MAEQSETTCHEKKERKGTDLEFSTTFSFQVRTYLLAYFVFAFDTPFQSETWNVAVTSDYLHMAPAIVPSHLYLCTSPKELTFKPESSPYLRMVLEEHILFRCFHTSIENLEPSVFSSHFNSLVIHPWLADQDRVLWPVLSGQLPVS